MANYVYNIAKTQLINGTMDLTADDIRVILLEASSDTNPDDADVAAVLARAGTTELTSTGYARADGILTGEAVAQDDANDRAEFDAVDAVFSGVSQLAAETCSGYLVFKFITNDAGSIPILVVDSFSAVTPNGSDITVTWDAEGILQAT